MENLTNEDHEFAEIYNRIEKRYTAGRVLILSIGLFSMLLIYLFQ